MSEFFSQNSMYVVLIVTLAVWLGIYLYLFRLEKRVKRLEQNK